MYDGVRFTMYGGDGGEVGFVDVDGDSVDVDEGMMLMMMVVYDGRRTIMTTVRLVLVLMMRVVYDDIILMMRVAIKTKMLLNYGDGKEDDEEDNVDKDADGDADNEDDEEVVVVGVETACVVESSATSSEDKGVVP